MSFLTKFTAEGKRNAVINQAVTAGEQALKPESLPVQYTAEELAAVQGIIRESVDVAMTTGRDAWGEKKGKYAQKLETLLEQLEQNHPAQKHAVQKALNAAEKIVTNHLVRAH